MSLPVKDRVRNWQPSPEESLLLTDTIIGMPSDLISKFFVVVRFFRKLGHRGRAL